MTTKLTVLVAGSTRMLGTKIVSAPLPLAISASLNCDQKNVS